MNARQISLLAALSAIWGGSYLLIKYALDGYSAGAIVSFRCLLASGVLFGLIPGLRLADVDLNISLQEGGRSAGGSGKARRVRSFLVVSEIALAAVLLIAAGLLLRSFEKLRAVNAPVSDLTMSSRLPWDRLASSRCRPHSGVGAGVGVWAPWRAVTISTLAPLEFSQRAV